MLTRSLIDYPLIYAFCLKCGKGILVADAKAKIKINPFEPHACNPQPIRRGAVALCPDCGGTGEIVRGHPASDGRDGYDPCYICGGSGVVLE